MRRKTISATKKKKNTKNPLLETPEGSFYDYLLNCRELLETHCSFVLPPAEEEEEFLKRGPSFILSYHPALGPLYSIIGQKMQKGKVERGSSLHLEIADLYIENLILSGSLVIRADAIMGHKDNEGMLRFSHKTGRCSLKNVQVVNEGIEEEKKPHFWKGEKGRKERVEIILHGHAEFIAENITFGGPHLIEVEEGMRVIAEEAEGKISFKKEPLKELLPFWNYKIDSEQHILIERQC
ncbi:MAG: hypothetical protein HYZ47_04905 [Simkania negevensis]|nr:hypothetical protein [Simkania negevensis]